MRASSPGSVFDLQQTIKPNRLSGLWLMMTGFRLKYALATVSLGVSATAKTLTYLLLRYFIDNYFVDKNPAVGIGWIALGFIALAMTEGGLSFLSTRLASQTAEGVTRRLRNYLFDHIQKLTFAYHDKTQTGELIQRSTSDVDAIRRFYSEQAIGVGRVILLFIINLIAILNLNTRLALISIVMLPIIVIVSFFFFKRISKIYESFQEQDATLSTTLQENLAGVRVVKAFSRQQFEIQKFEKDNWEKFQRGRRLLTMHSLFWPVSDTICVIQILLGYFISATMAIQNEITIGTYLAYAGLLVWIIFPMRNLGRLIVNVSTGIVSFGRVLDIIKEPQEPLGQGNYQPQGDVQGHLVFDKVGFEYEPGSIALADISFECQPGQVIALLGSTGSGKTSLVNLLPRFYDYTHGKILLDGIELNQYPRTYLRQQIGIVEQEPFLFSRTIRDNITYGVGRVVSDEEIFYAARAAAIHDVIMSFPSGYQTMIGEKGVTLSGGQKQRIAIARTLLKNPKVLILDDSTSSVDTETEAEIRDAMQYLMKNRTTFIIAHRIQSIMDADLILVMEHGKITQSGNHSTLHQQAGIYRDIFEIQTRIENELSQEIANVS